MISKRLYGSKLFVYAFGESRPYTVAKELKELELDNRSFMELPSIKDAITFLSAVCFAEVTTNKKAADYVKDSQNFIDTMVKLFENKQDVLNIREVVIAEDFQRINYYKGEPNEFYRGAKMDKYIENHAPENVIKPNRAVYISNAFLCALWLEIFGDKDWEMNGDYDRYARGRMETLVKIDKFLADELDPNSK